MYDVDTHAYDEEHRARVRADECSQQDPGAPPLPETSEPTAGLDVAPAAPQVTSKERE